MSRPAGTQGQRSTVGPLDGVLRHHGATMVVRNGRCVAAHFGSPTSETAVCLSTVGIADRSDRTTFELRGAASDVEAAIAALAPLGPRASSRCISSQSAIVRCDAGDAAACSAALSAADVAAEITDRFAAIEVIGPRAAELLETVDLTESGAVVLPGGRDRVNSYELVIGAERGTALWIRLLEAGAPLSIACVGLDALEHLAVSNRLSRPASHTVS